MKKTFEEISAAWEKAQLTSKAREEFQEKWSLALQETGWTREEFHTETDQRSRLNAEEVNRRSQSNTQP